MIRYLIVAVLLVAAVLVVTTVVGGRQMRRVLADFDIAPGTDLEPVRLPAVSTLPETDDDGWSASVGFNAWRAWLDAKHEALFPAQPAIFAEMAERYLNPRRELPAAPKRRTRRTKTIGATS